MAPSSPAADLWTGRLVGGRWRIVSLLDDSGGMASVYLADDERLPRKAVVKIPKAAALNDEFRSRFAREARLHAQVTDRNVVQVLDGGEEAGTPYLVLRYLPGGNLKAWCDRNPSILADPRLHYESWLLPIAQALDAVAAQGIIHRDVKPSNILFDSGGQAYLSDFGIVKGQDEGTLAKTGMLIGTLQFMSPEQCHEEKRHALDGRSDQFGLAVTAYQVLTGWKYPVADDTAVIYAAKFGHSPMKEPRDHDPRIPQAVNDAVMRALAADREWRFASSVEFAKAVLAGFGGAALTGPGSAHTGSARRPVPPPPPPTVRPSAATVDTAPQERKPAGGAGDFSGRPPRPAGDPRQGGPPGPAAIAWTPFKVMAGVAVLVAVLVAGLAGAFLLRRGGGEQVGDAGRWMDRGAEPQATGGGTPPSGGRGEVVENSLGMKFVLIPAGVFQMGGKTVADLERAGIEVPDSVEEFIPAERPVHRVRVTKPFLLGQTEVTLGQFLEFYNDDYVGRLDCEQDGKGGRGFDAAKPDRMFVQKPHYRPWSWGHPDMGLTTEAGRQAAHRHPVVNVSWNDCVAFCEWLSRKEGRRYRLPTEAEWEYACRGGTTTHYWTGDDPESLAASENVSDRSARAFFIQPSETLSAEDGHAFTAPVGSFDRLNPFGLADMQGNVAEWCGDWYDAEYYAQSPAADPQGPASAGTFRVFRGGGWKDAPVFCRSAFRNFESPAYRDSSIGFRVVRELD